MVEALDSEPLQNVHFKFMLFVGQHIHCHGPDGKFIPGVLDKFHTIGRYIKNSPNREFSSNEYDFSSAILKKKTSFLEEFITKGQGHKVLASLRVAVNRPYVNKDVCVLFLAAFIRLSSTEHKELVAEAYSSLPIICYNSQLLFFLLQILKLMDKEGNISWGRGFRKAIKSWYLRFKPKDLALELTRNTKGYGWRHKDILKLAHINQKTLPIETQIVLSYLFTGMGPTVALYGHIDKGKHLLGCMRNLNRHGMHLALGEEPAELAGFLKNYIDRLHTSFGEISLKDLPEAPLKHEEVWLQIPFEKFDSESLIAMVSKTNIVKFLQNDDSEDKLLLNYYLAALTAKRNEILKTISPFTVAVGLNAIFRYSRRSSSHSSKNWHGIKKVSSTRKTSGSSMNESLNKILDYFDALVTDTAKNLPETSYKAGLYESSSNEMYRYAFTTGNSKELRCCQISSLVCVYLNQGNWKNCRPAMMMNETFHRISDRENLSYRDVCLCPRKLIDSPKPDDDEWLLAALKEIKSSGVHTGVLVVYELTDDIITIVSAFADSYKEENEEKCLNTLRLILVGASTKNVLEGTVNFLQENLLILNGCPEEICNTIRAFHAREF